MPFCSACGTEVGAEGSFCPKCGKPVGAVTVTPSAGVVATTPAAGMQENVAALLCYVVGWVTGLVFFLIDKRPFVRFHAMQSIIIFGGINVLQWLLIGSGWFGGMVGWAFLGMVGSVLWLLVVVCWILCMVKAYQGQRFKLPVVGDMAENFSK